MTEADYIYLADEEYELRRINALEYIEAVNEAESLAEKYGDGIVTASVLRKACLVAKGAYVSGEKKFSSGEEVLETMSAREIYEAAEAYEMPKTEHGETEAAEGGTYTPGDTEAAESLRPAATVTEETPVRQNAFSGDTGVFMTFSKGAGSMEEQSAQSRQSSFGGAGYVNPAMRTDMRQISDFFERDSRRYGSAFEKI